MSKILALIAIAFVVSSFSGAPAQAAHGKVVWDYWYTVTVGKLPAEYYDEKVILHGDKLQFINDVWKKEEGYINQEELGAFAEANRELTPLFFNFRSTYRTTETIIDGTVHGKMLVVKVRRGGKELPTVTRSIDPNTFFSVFFPVWLHKVTPTLKLGVPVTFSTILEDDIKNGFQSEGGYIRLQKPDTYAQRTGTKKISVNYRDVRSFWWVEKNGSPVRTFMPDTDATIQRVSKAKAKAFLN